jgi:DNA-binding NarL/FixJ family response regulator
MPEMNGFEVAQALQEHFPEIRIIFVTDRPERAYADRAFELGAQGYVVKSAAATELPLALKRSACRGHIPPIQEP